MSGEILESILNSFRAPIRFAFGYGSGVYPQKGYRPSDSVSSYNIHLKPQIDLIFGVTHTEHWHSLNLIQNKSHYSGLCYLGENTISSLQKDFGAFVYFNTLIKINGRVKILQNKLLEC